MGNSSNFEKRFINYGVVNDGEELECFIANAETTANMFFEEEREQAAKFGNCLFNKELGPMFYDEMALRFTIGFCEGALFRSMQLLNNMIQAGYSDDDIMRILRMSKSKISEVRLKLSQD